MTEDVDWTLFHGIVNYMQYYKRRHLLDTRVEKIIQSESFTLEQGWRLIAIGGELVPLMLRMRKNSDNLYTRYVATSILEAIRRIQAIKSMVELLERPIGEVVHESLYDRLSLLDRAYDRIAPYRTAMIKNIVGTVRRDPRLIDCVSSTEVVLLIIEAICKELHSVVDERTYLQESLDNISIQRHYAGEVGASGMIKYAIIGGLADKFNIKCDLCNTFLIVKDPYFEGGKSYISLKSGTFQPSVYSVREIYPAVLRSNPREPQRALQSLIRPWTAKMAIEALIEFQQTDSIVREATMRERIVDYEAIYPRSKIHVMTGTCDYYANCFHEYYKSRVDTILLVEMARRFPFDALFFEEFFKDHSEVDFKQIALESYLQPNFDGEFVNICPGTPFKLGQVVKHVSGVISVIVGAYTLITEGSQTTRIFYRLLNGLDVSGARIELLQQIPHSKLQALMNFYDIGIYFTHFDEERSLFVPHERLKVAYDWL